MTQRELKQYFYIDKEIKDEKLRLAELEKSSAPAQEIDETREVIRCKMREAELMRLRIIREIMQIDDAFLRQIFMYRHIDLLSWAAVAVRVGGDNTPDGVRKAHDRYITRSNDA